MNPGFRFHNINNNINNNINIRKIALLVAVCMLTLAIRIPAVSATETAGYGYYRILDSVNVRSGPGLDYEVIGTLSAEDPVPVSDFSGYWAKITCSNGTVGWVNVDYISQTDSTTGSSTDGSSSSASGDNGTAGNNSTGTNSTGTNSTGTNSTGMDSEGTDSTGLASTGNDSTGTGSSDSYTTCTPELYEASSAGTSLYETPSEEEDPLITLYAGNFFHITEKKNDSWGKVNWNGKELWIKLDSAAFIEVETTSAADSESSGSDYETSGAEAGTIDTEEENGWIQRNDTWYYYNEEGKFQYISSSLHEEWESIQDCYSPTEYYIVVNCTANETAIFTGSGPDNWKPYIFWSCSTGREGHETMKGTFSVVDKGYSFGEEEYSCYYFTQFAEKYLFHSVLYEAGTFNLQDGTMGQNVSNGCVRLALENAKWMYDNIPLGTMVYIY